MRNMDWVDASPFKNLLAAIYWSPSYVKMTPETFDLVRRQHPDKFDHPIHVTLREAGLLGILFGKLIFTKTEE